MHPPNSGGIWPAIELRDKQNDALEELNNKKKEELERRRQEKIKQEMERKEQEESRKQREEASEILWIPRIILSQNS